MVAILIILTLVVAGVVGVVALSPRRGNRRLAFDDAAKRLSARASGNELRSEIDGFTVNVRVEDRRITAHARLEEGTETLRIFIGWDVPAVPDGLAHFPEIALPVAYTFAGTMTTRASERELADRFLERAAASLIELRTSTGAASLAVTVRGGHVELALAQTKETAEAIEQIARTTAALARRLALSERSLPALPAERRCAACVDTGGDEWTSCPKCGANYHVACFAKGGGCVAPGCT